MRRVSYELPSLDNTIHDEDERVELLAMAIADIEEIDPEKDPVEPVVDAMAPFVIDMLLVRLREMRFSFDIITMAINEREFISAAPIATEEVNAGYVHAGVVIVVATLFAWMRSGRSWTNLAHWNPTHFVVCIILSRLSLPPPGP
ncbi:unnamed protein product [Phytophthora fragariaefolia]|uniref:Unnamed protein product n=1 Tax=Phytophthora fragariaefolia TaxID=1490495 RepID=A0A9W6WUS8_9STRA|nr:unnamed protein product [Phytophthora fragariaefolia]